MKEKVELTLGDSSLIFETGKIAKQANGAALVCYEGSAVLATACASRSENRELDYLPLTVNYVEKFYAAGKIPGGFFKREGRPQEKEILVSRLIDRPLRPLFSKNLGRELQIIATTMSTDQINPPDILAMNGASLAVGLSDIPMKKLVGAVRVGMLGDSYVINPTYSQMEEVRLEIVVAGTDDAIVMVEGGAREVSEEELLGAISFAEPYISRIIKAQEELVDRVGKTKMEVPEESVDEKLVAAVRDFAYERYAEACFVPTKRARQDALDGVGEATMDMVEEQFGAESLPQVYEILEDIEKEIVRESIIKEGKRSDGRGLRDIRPIDIETNLFQRTHGSAMFTRGETQSVAITSLGTVSDEQRYDNIEGEGTKTFMLHYNFPPFSVGETKGRLGPGRREIGHGHLAERSIKPLIPEKEDFPYTIRVVSEITESNGSSSMASICAGSLSLLSAGVPLRDSVAGVAMGLVFEDAGRFAILSDILGSEDHLGDMDFKVAGTRKGITGFQMDVKISGISMEIMSKALEQAKEGRLHILDRMADVIEKPVDSISRYAPKILILKVPQEKIGTIIGPSGKMIRSIIEETGTNINVEDDGTVTISATGDGDAERAHDTIQSLIAEIEVGKTYEGEVKRIMDFGAFVEIQPGKEGLVHISKLEHHRVNKVTDVLNVGDRVKVKVTEIDALGRINLSRKALLPNPNPHSRSESGARSDRKAGPTSESGARSDRKPGPTSESEARSDRKPGATSESDARSNRKPEARSESESRSGHRSGSHRNSSRRRT
jgi:polyribonucleotide nucleotidyltransferase